MPDIRVTGESVERQHEVLTPAALRFVADLQPRIEFHSDELLTNALNSGADLLTVPANELVG